LFDLPAIFLGTTSGFGLLQLNKTRFTEQLLDPRLNGLSLCFLTILTVCDERPIIPAQGAAPKANVPWDLIAGIGVGRFFCFGGFPELGRSVN